MSHAVSAMADVAKPEIVKASPARIAFFIDVSPSLIVFPLSLSRGQDGAVYFQYTARIPNEEDYMNVF
jgi:hypothetical protein